MWNAFMIFLCLFSLLQQINGEVLSKAVHIRSKLTNLASLRASDVTTIHTVIIGITQNNLDHLEHLVDDISDVTSAKYGQFLAHDEVALLTHDGDRVRRVIDYFQDKGLKVVRKTKHSEYITMQGPIHVWSSIFNATFHDVAHKVNSKTVVKSVVHELWIPQSLSADIASVFNMLPMPPLTTSSSLTHADKVFVIPATQSSTTPINASASTPALSSFCPDDSYLSYCWGELQCIRTGSVCCETPSILCPSTDVCAPTGCCPTNHAYYAATTCIFNTLAALKSAYNIMNTTVEDTAISQQVVGTLGQYYSSDDLTKFQTVFNVPIEAVSSSVGNHSSNTVCLSSPDSCKEANLDLQYIMSIAQSSRTSYYYDDAAIMDGFINYIVTMVRMMETHSNSSDDKPSVISISYGYDERKLDPFVVQAFEVEALKLSAMGVTIVVASGDDGAHSKEARSTPSECGYTVSFPASSKYVVAVGATSGPETSTTEVACQADNGKFITSGGGFSGYINRAPFQKDAIKSYFDSFSTSTDKPSPLHGYSANGRGLPDVSLLGTKYSVVVGGEIYYISGTSASAPVVAAMVTLVNAARRRRGMSILGWITPSLYRDYEAYTNDITDGNNYCTGGWGYTCCDQGFAATQGWDPVTGLGSIDFSKFIYYYAYNTNPTFSPTVTVTTPTGHPTNDPTHKPSISLPPTSVPVLSPTLVPSYSQTPTRLPFALQTDTEYVFYTINTVFTGEGIYAKDFNQYVQNAFSFSIEQITNTTTTPATVLEVSSITDDAISAYTEYVNSSVCLVANISYSRSVGYPTLAEVTAMLNDQEHIVTIKRTVIAATSNNTLKTKLSDCSVTSSTSLAFPAPILTTESPSEPSVLYSTRPLDDPIFSNLMLVIIIAIGAGVCLFFIILFCCFSIRRISSKYTNIHPLHPINP